MEILGVLKPLNEATPESTFPPPPCLYANYPSTDTGDAAKIGGILPSGLHTGKPPLDEPEAAFVICYSSKAQLRPSAGKAELQLGTLSFPPFPGCFPLHCTALWRGMSTTDCL